MSTWDEAFSERYELWSAAMTEDIAFYVGLARQADGPLAHATVVPRRWPAESGHGANL